MVDLEIVQSWVEEEGYETEPVEPKDSDVEEWRLRVPFPAGSDYRQDIIHLSGRETLAISSSNDLDSAENLQEAASNERLIRFRLGLREALLGQAIRFQLLPVEPSSPIEVAAFEKSLYADEISKSSVLRGMEEIHRGLSLLSNHFQFLALDTSGGESENDG